MNSLRIRTKLRLALAILALMTVGLALFAVHSMASIDAAGSEVATRYLPRATDLGRVQHYLTLYRTSEAEHLLADDARSLRAVEDRQADLRATADRTIAELSNSTMSPDVATSTRPRCNGSHTSRRARRPSRPPGAATRPARSPASRTAAPASTSSRTTSRR